MTRPFHERRARAGKLSGWLLLVLPILLLLGFFWLNIQLISHARAVQLKVTDASALAAAQGIVDDTMLDGTPPNLANLEQVARVQAQFYSNFNPLGQLPIQYADEDITFTRIANPYDASLELIETVQVVGKRTCENNNAVQLLGQGLFGISGVNVVTTSKGTLDRHVAGFRPVFFNNLPLAPVAFLETDWAAQIETAYAATNTYTITLAVPSTDVKFLAIGTTTEAEIGAQLTGGISPGDLNGFGGQLVLDGNNELKVPEFSPPVTPANLKSDLQAIVDRRIAWPLFSTMDGTDVVISRFVAARITSVADGPGADELTLTLQPAFVSDPSVVTESTRAINLYLARVRLSN